MTWLWYIIAFMAGAIFMWKFAGFALRLVFGRGYQLRHVLKNLDPDSFIRLRKAINEETTRRNSL